MLADPLWIFSAVHDRPDRYDLGLHRVIDRIRKDPAQGPSVVPVGQAVNSTRDFQALDVAFEGIAEVRPKTFFLTLVEKETFFQILQGIGGDVDPDHARPSECFT